MASARFNFPIGLRIGVWLGLGEHIISLSPNDVEKIVREWPLHTTEERPLIWEYQRIPNSIRNKPSKYNFEGFF